jgi:ABC-type amino acid transport substrate-binding protein
MDAKSGDKLVWLALLSLLAPSSQARAAEPQPPPEKLIVATRNVPPFAMPAPDGRWDGIAIELWREIAAELGRASEFRATSIPEMLAGLQDGTFDAAVAALTMTAEREQSVDFTHPFYVAGLGIAAPAEPSGGWTGVVRRLLSSGFLKVVAALAVLLFVIGLLVWFAERRRNKEQFGGGVARGVGSGFWWSAVTMTTVGYGDKAPRTVAGRTLAIIWMFASIIVISSFTAAIASALTVSQLDVGVSGPEDLPGLRVATVRGTTSEAYLRDRRIRALPFDTALDGLRAVAEGRADAMVYDAPILRFLAKTETQGEVRVLPREFERQSYAIGLPPGSPLRESINRVILRTTVGQQWRDLLFQYLGE